MNAIEIKQNFHALIDDFADENLLKEFYEIISSYKNKKVIVGVFDDLTEQQKLRLYQSIEQAKRNETLDHAQVKSELEQWLSK